MKKDGLQALTDAITYLVTGSLVSMMIALLYVCLLVVGVVARLLQARRKLARKSKLVNPD